VGGSAGKCGQEGASPLGKRLKGIAFVWSVVGTGPCGTVKRGASLNMEMEMVARVKVIIATHAKRTQNVNTGSG
jgi:hypothetical protein